MLEEYDMPTRSSNLILKGFTSIERNNLNLVLAKILIKGKGNSCLIDG